MKFWLLSDSTVSTVAIRLNASTSILLFDAFLPINDCLMIDNSDCIICISTLLCNLVQLIFHYK